MNSILAFIQSIFTHAVQEESLLNATEAQLKPEEGYRRFPYIDTKGKITEGYGFNLTDDGLYPEEADFMIKFRTHKAMVEVINKLPWSTSLSERRRVVLNDMAYNMGIGGLMAFVSFLKALESGQYEEASQAMLNSLWARQVGKRANHLAQIIREG